MPIRFLLHVLFALSTVTGPRVLPRELWAFQTHGRISGAPIVTRDDDIVVVSADQFVTKLSSSGVERFRFDAGAPIHATPTILDDGTVIVGTDAGDVIALSPALEVRWRKHLARGILSAVVSAGSRIYFAADGVYALTLNGEVAWHVPCAGIVVAAPTITRHGLALFSTIDGVLHAIDAHGTEAWRYSATQLVDAPVLELDDGILIVATDRGAVHALTPSGTLIWKAEISTAIHTAPTVAADDTIVIANDAGHVVDLRRDGTIAWNSPFSGRIRSTPIHDAAGHIYFGSEDGFVRAIDANGNLVWQYNVGSDVDPTIAFGKDGTLYVGADDGALHALR